VVAEHSVVFPELIVIPTSEAQSGKQLAGKIETGKSRHRQVSDDGVECAWVRAKKLDRPDRVGFAGYWQLRHSDPRMTLGVYAHIVGDAHRGAVEKVTSILDLGGLKSGEESSMIQ
jgi:hypothetical protein